MSQISTLAPSTTPMPSRPPSGLHPSAATGPGSPGRRIATFRGESTSQISTPTSRVSSATASCFPSGRIASGIGWNSTEKRATSRPNVTSATTTVRSARPTASRRESAANSAWSTGPATFQTNPPPSASRTCRPSGSTMASHRPSALSRKSRGTSPTSAIRATGVTCPIVCTETTPCPSNDAYRRNIPSKTGGLAPVGTSIATFPGRRSARATQAIASSRSSSNPESGASTARAIGMACRSDSSPSSRRPGRRPNRPAWARARYDRQSLS